MTDQQSTYVGGCLCGALRYEASGEPLYAGHCYCADCRKVSGSGFVAFMGFPPGAVRVSGPSRAFTSRAANGNDATRNSCPVCGSLVFGGNREAGDGLNVYAGTLDEPQRFHPTVAVFTHGRPAWAVVPQGLESHERGY